jgi:hypothetical protein
MGSWNGNLVVQGGHGGTLSFLNDVWLLDLQTFVWQELAGKKTLNVAHSKLSPNFVQTKSKTCPNLSLYGGPARWHPPSTRVALLPNYTTVSSCLLFKNLSALQPVGLSSSSSTPLSCLVALVAVLVWPCFLTSCPSLYMPAMCFALQVHLPTLHFHRDACMLPVRSVAIHCLSTGATVTVALTSKICKLFI